jgi:chromosome segregation ATPase
MGSDVVEAMASPHGETLAEVTEVEVTSQRGEALVSQRDRLTRKFQKQLELLTSAYQSSQNQLFTAQAHMQASIAQVPGLWQDLETAENAKRELESANAALQQKLRDALREVLWLRLELKKAECACARPSKRLLDTSA